MNLYILRHGESLTDYPDIIRPLSDEGKKDIEKVGKFLVDKKINIEKIFTSPYKRAFQSAEIIAKCLNLQISIGETESLLPDADPRQIVALLNETESRSTLLVTHQPFMGSLVASLIGCKNLQIEIRKGAILNIESNYPIVEGKCILKFLIHPDII